MRKHARPDRVEVRLDYLPDQIHLAVEDYGLPPEGGAGVRGAASPGRGRGVRPPGATPPGASMA